MSSFRRYGGLNYSATNNITRSYISNSEQMNVNNYSGQQHIVDENQVFIDQLQIDKLNVIGRPIHTICRLFLSLHPHLLFQLLLHNIFTWQMKN